MSRSVKIILVLVLVVFIAGTVYFLRTWYMPHRDVKDEKAITQTAQGIIDAYNSNEKQANTLYLDKAIEVSGEVTGVEKTQQGKTVVSLKTTDPMAGVRCTMKEDAVVKVGDQIRVKGICTGFMMDVTLIDCYVLK